MRFRDGAVLLLLTVMLPALPVQAHKPSDSYLHINSEKTLLSGRWDIGLADLDYALQLDADGDGELLWGEVRAREAEIGAYALARLGIEAGDGRACALSVGDLRVIDLSDGPYLALSLQGECPPAPRALRLRYTLFFDLDPSHRGLLQLTFDGEHRTGVFAPARRALDFQAGRLAPLSALRQYLREGLMHIALGLDHLLFLAGLLLPAVLRREPGRWVPAETAGGALMDVLKIVTAFTLAHACTLSLATLGLLRLPTRLVESAIAATIIFAALNNLRPVITRRLWLLAFGFGLIHGAGYASLLGDLGLSGWTLALALLGFNLGIEGMQAAIALLLVPAAFALRRQVWYQWGVVAAGSILVALLGLLWFLERAFDLRPGL